MTVTTIDPSTGRPLATDAETTAEELHGLLDRAHSAAGGEQRIEELAELTGVARATLYYYFSGKDDVVAFLISQQLRRGTAAVAGAARTQGAPSVRLEAVLRAMFHVMAEHPSLCTQLMRMTAREGTAGQLTADFERTLMAPVRDLLLEGQNAGDLAVTDLTDTTLSLMGAVSTVSMAHVARWAPLSPTRSPIGSYLNCSTASAREAEQGRGPSLAADARGGPGPPLPVRSDSVETRGFTTSPLREEGRHLGFPIPHGAALL